MTHRDTLAGHVAFGEGMRKNEDATPNCTHSEIAEISNAASPARPSSKAPVERVFTLPWNRIEFDNSHC